MQTTHRRLGKRYVQVVTPSTLRRILTETGQDFDKPDWMSPEDEWDVGERAREKADFTIRSDDHDTALHEFELFDSIGKGNVNYLPQPWDVQVEIEDDDDEEDE